MSATFQSWPTKLAVLLIGAALGVAGSKDKPSAPVIVPAPAENFRLESKPSRPTASAAPRVSESTRAPAPQSTEDYAAAWESLKDGKLQRTERVELQRQLLAEWAEIDLESALHAYFGDPPMNRDAFLWSPLNDIFLSAISRQQGLTWELIQKHAFGPRTSELRQEWIRAKGDGDPIGLLSHLDDLPPWRESKFGTSREWAVSSALRGAHATGADPALGSTVLTRLLAIPADQGGSQAVKAARDYLPRQSPETLTHGISTATDPAIREIYLDALVTRLRNIDNYVQEKVKQVPAELRAEVAAELRARGDH